MHYISKNTLIQSLLEKGYLVSPESLDDLSEDEVTQLNPSQEQLLLDRSSLLSTDPSFEKKHDMYSPATQALSQEQKQAPADSPLIILSSYTKPPTKKDVGCFIKYFNHRLQTIGAYLRQRQELSSLVSIARALSKQEKEAVAIVGMISNITVTKNKNVLLTLEDQTGQIQVLVSQNKPELSALVKNLVLDEVIGVCGTASKKIIFANAIIQPDIPFYKELKKSPEDEYALFLSDLHIGSHYFLSEEFEKFFLWLNGSVGTDAQKALVSKIKYLFVVGDLVDGVGIYPGQEKELTIPDIFRQYEVCAEYLKKIPPHIKVVLCAGNHDAVRLAEPQPIFDREISAPLYNLPNVTIVSNPSYLTFGKTATFPGFDVLLYHGYSFDHYIANVHEIRNSGGYDRADLVMKFLLQRRHLSPTHAACLYVPDFEEDPLVINRIPDFFVTGHIHKSCVATYRNVTLISGSCWQAKTAFQEKMGHHPEPCRVPLVNLKTRDVKILRFGSA